MPGKDPEDQDVVSRDPTKAEERGFLHDRGRGKSSSGRLKKGGPEFGRIDPGDGTET